MNLKPAGFMSYVRLDDKYEEGRLSEFCERLGGELRIQTGDEFHIFQDRNDIAWGQQWKQRVDESLDSTTFLIPIITSAFFKSPACRDELQRFLDREKELDRADLILPIYYVNCPLLNDKEKRKNDELAQIIAGRQYADWREFRFSSFTSDAIRREFAKLATQILEALERDSYTKTPAQVIITNANTHAVSQENVVRQQAESELLRGVVGPSPKTDPPTHVVDPFNRGDYLTLNEALDAAAPGDRILVRHGLYRESIIIEKPVEILGDGEMDEIVIEGVEQSAVTFRASMGRMTNLTIRQSTNNDSYCVIITQGRLELEDCDISSQDYACVGIHGGADPRLRRNRIHNGKNVGIFVFQNGRGIFEDNEIFENGSAGVVIWNGANPTLRRNRIYACEGNGVLVLDKGQGTLEDNEIFDNSMPGVAISEDSNPTLRRNSIHSGKTNGIIVYNNGRGTLEDNEIFDNAAAGVAISGKSNPILRGNRIYNGLENGVLLYGSSAGVIVDNEIFGNALSGVSIAESSNPILRNNRIVDGKQSGITVYENGEGTIVDNEIVGNAYSGVAVWRGGSPTLRNNRISRNGIWGISVTDGGGGLFEDNELEENSLGSWNVSPECEENVKRKGNQDESSDD